MGTNESVETIKTDLKLIGELKAAFKLQRNNDGCGPLVFAGVAESNIIPAISESVEKVFGKPYKAAGEGAILKNWFDGFVKAVGGVRTDQTLFRKTISPKLDLFCAFWPWGSNPVKTSIRLGLICYEEADEEEMAKALKGQF